MIINNTKLFKIISLLIVLLFFIIYWSTKNMVNLVYLRIHYTEASFIYNIQILNIHLYLIIIILLLISESVNLGSLIETA